MKTLIDKARKLRVDTVHLSVESRNGHVASAFSCIEILTILYERIMGSNDRFIMSKGHGALGLFAQLRLKGFRPTISGHPDIESDQGIECTTGSLGHGIGIGVGMALAKKIKNHDGHIYVLLGDGECQEGSVWETLNIIRKLSITNITLIVDCNGLQALDSVKNILAETDLKTKFAAFGCRPFDVDGHDFQELDNALAASIGDLDNTYVILARTVKGKGISFMEHVPGWHSRMLEGELLTQALRELS